MKYFESFPKIAVYDGKGGYTLATNLLLRTNIIGDLLNDETVFYDYDVQEFDTPETIADKYYGDVYRYWIILFVNKLLNPVWDWPLNQQQFNSFIQDKYQTAAAAAGKTVLEYMQTTVKYYRKTITTTDMYSQQTTTENYSIDYDVYVALQPSKTSIQLPSGEYTIVEISKQAVDLYTYEMENNERNRSLRLLNVNFVSQIEQELNQLMNS